MAWQVAFGKRVRPETKTGFDGDRTETVTAPFVADDHWHRPSGWQTAVGTLPTSRSFRGSGCRLAPGAWRHGACRRFRAVVGVWQVRGT